MLYWPYKRLELKQGTQTYREKEASIMREHIPQSALQAVSFSYRCFWFRYYSDPGIHMDSMTEQAAQAARAARGIRWHLDEGSQKVR